MIKYLSVAWIIAIACVGVAQDFLASAYLPIFWGLLCCALLGSAIFWLKIDANRFVGLRLLFKFVAAISVFILGWNYANTQLEYYLKQEVQVRQTVEGIVYIKNISDGKLENWRQNAELLLPKENRSLKILLYPKRIYDAQGEMIGLSTEQLKLGHFYQVTVDIKPPHGYVNAGGFDQEKWLLQNRIQGTATVLFSREIAADEIQAMGWYQFVVDQQRLLQRWQLWIEQLRQDYRQQIIATDPSNQNKALLLGLLTGDRSAINKETIQLYQYMGISHLLAISGPHVLILAAMLTWLLMQILHRLMLRGFASRLYQYLPKQCVYLPIFLLCVSFYVTFTGFEIPALRTWIIATICSLSLLLRFKIAPFTLLLIAASVVLWWDCFAILSAAFWLSFGASAILLLIYQQIQQQQYDEYLTYIERFYEYAKLLWQSQWRIFVALLPIVLWQFQAISLISPIINLIAIPFLSLIIVPLDIIAALIWQIFPLFAQMIWSIAAFLLAIFNAILHILEPIAIWLYLPSYLTWWHLISLTFAIVILSLPKGLIAKYWSIFFLIPLIFPQQRPVLQLDVLDVGQGQAIALQTKQHQMLIDTGMSAWQAGQPSMGDQVVVPFLRSQGIRSLDEILLSHLDADHSGGTAAIIENINVKQLRSNVYDAERTNYTDVAFLQCSRGQSWQWDGVDIQILSPTIDAIRKDQNESSCVVLISTSMQQQELKILIMGDAGWQTEYEILQQYPDLAVDILIVGHHGSRHSSAYDFLKQINPKLAVISVGLDNRYGHPTPELIARLKDLNIAYLSTANMGALHFELLNDTALWSWRAERQKRQWLLPRTMLRNSDTAN